jgi:predicted ATPase/class 3 adenylate cyclase
MARTETATVVFTDLVGSTELASRLGHDAYEALRQEHFTALRTAVAKHGGTEVKTTGDGLMLRFDSAAHAIACAVAMQQAVDGAVRRRPPSGPPLVRGEDREVQIRVGISAGEATHEDNDLYGLPVVEAARLCAAATAGQILTSDVVRALARGRGHAFRLVGELTLKGLPEPVAACEVQWEPLPETSTRVPLPPRLSATQAIAMVGRTVEQAVLARAWAQARDGQRQAVLLSGEPGIGKTRLATETARATHAEGATVLLGTCDEDVNLPYQPFVEALRHYVAHAPDEVLAAHVREHKGELGRLVPELARRLPDLRAPQVAEGETERYLLFEAAAGLLSAASQHTPLVLILDDLQWAGAPDLLLLKHVLHSTMPLRLLIIATYRDSDLTRAHPLTAVLADLRREPGVERLALHGLDEAAVVALLTSAARHEIEAPGLALAHAIHQETEGSPFFIGEILRHLTESGAIFREGDRWTYRGEVTGLGIPDGIKEVIGRRLSRLSESTNKVLSLAAVIGRQFDLALLQQVADASALLPVPSDPSAVRNPQSAIEDVILDALDEATRAALVAEVPGEPDHFSFSHALIRTTLYEELSVSRRARLHRRIGEALEALTSGRPEARIDELAHHWLSATQVTDVAKAIGYARQAGDRALAHLAFEEAAAHYERALSVLVPQDRAGEELHCDLLLALGHARRSAGNATYRDAVKLAAELARKLGDAERLAHAALGHARPSGYIANAVVTDHDLIALYGEASEQVGTADSVLRARILGQLAVELSYGPDRERRDALTRDAVAIARRLGDRGALAQALVARAWAMNDPTTLAERLLVTEQIRTLANELGSIELDFQGAFFRTGALLEAGNVTAAEGAKADCERIAAELRQPFYAWWTAMQRAAWALVRGAPDAEAQSTVATALAIAAQTGQPFFDVDLHRLDGDLILATRGDPDEAAARFHRALAIAREQGARSFELRAATSLARLWRDQGKRAEARALLAPIYGWFTEGFDTGDLKDAKALLEELSR